MTATTTPTITEVRQALLDTLKDLRSRDNPMEVERARAVAQVAGVLVDTARVEVDFLKVTGGDRSDFLGHADPQLPAPSSTPTAHNPFPGQRHGIRG